jgi:hypothetical protein
MPVACAGDRLKAYMRVAPVDASALDCTGVPPETKKDCPLAAFRFAKKKVPSLDRVLVPLTAPPGLIRLN